MTSIEATRVDFLPIRSPKWPNSTDPIGRAMKAMPKVRNAASDCAAGADVGKKVGPITSAAAVPYR